MTGWFEYTSAWVERSVSVDVVGGMVVVLGGVAASYNTVWKLCGFAIFWKATEEAQPHQAFSKVAMMLPKGSDMSIDVGIDTVECL